MDEEIVTEFSKEVGRRLRAVRRQHALSLEDVEARSKGRWSASAVGAYERGYRNLSLPRLGELADFYKVAVSSLLTDDSARPASARGPAVDPTAPICISIAALKDQPDDEAETVLRYARSIVSERRGPAPTVVTLRRSDVALLSSILGCSALGLHQQLRHWGALVDDDERATA
ncbi:MAG TPA: helix-turn-helix transcriptional regulator [Acidimicrobiales bacterium]|nr:helix-turn-helix transcriptional regulator [Acidimicrobiales bacterium]